LVPEERCEVVKCTRCKLVPQEHCCKVPYTTCRLITEEHCKLVPQTTCTLQPFCVTYKICRQVPVCVPVCEPSCAPPPPPPPSSWKPGLPRNVAALLRKDSVNEPELIEKTSVK
jgi:hypothetical protein